METSLHRSLKQLYAADATLTEVAVDGFRIDAIDAQGCLVEVQHAGLGSIRRKVMRLADAYAIRVVKPLVTRKWIERVDPKSNMRISRRRSPKQATAIDIFAHLLHFTGAFPHPNLTLEIPFVEIIDLRHPLKRRRRWRQKDKSIDQVLIRVTDTLEIRSNQDLWQLMGQPIVSESFDTQQLAEAIGQSRNVAQQITYVLRHSGAISAIGKKGNSIIYCRTEHLKSKKRLKAA